MLKTPQNLGVKIQNSRRNKIPSLGGCEGKCEQNLGFWLYPSLQDWCLPSGVKTTAERQMELCACRLSEKVAYPWHSVPRSKMLTFPVTSSVLLHF